MQNHSSRREFLAASTLVFLARALRATPLAAAAIPSRPSPTHPTPRPGITAEKVLHADHLADTPDAIPVFDMVREIPGIVDGIRCTCGCAESPDFYSLLSCYEGPDAMAKSCQICQGQGRLAFRLHKAGKSLDEIRKGIDARYG